MSKGWYGNKEKHSLASKGIKSKVKHIGKRFYGWQVVWKQEDENEKLKQYREVFETEEKAREHIRKLYKSGESIGKQVKILTIEEVD